MPDQVPHSSMNFNQLRSFGVTAQDNPFGGPIDIQDPEKKNTNKSLVSRQCWLLTTDARSLAWSIGTRWRYHEVLDLAADKDKASVSYNCIELVHFVCLFVTICNLTSAFDLLFLLNIENYNQL